MKNLLLSITVLLLLSSCSAVKNAFQPKASSAPVTTKQSPLIEHIEIKQEQTPAVIRTSSGQQSNVFNTKQVVSEYSSLELFSLTQFKYAIRLNIPVEQVQNKSLYNVIDEWWGTPYRLGGTTHKGIDCSAFVQTIILGVFAVQLPRTAREQRGISEWIPVDDLREGDLVFFNTRGGVSHVGVYLHNNKFVHASTSSGVMISDLHDTYWSRKLIDAGRVLQNINPRP